MTAVYEGQHVRRCVSGEVTGSLGRTEIAAVGERGLDVPTAGVFDLGRLTRQGPEVPRPLRPAVHIGEDVEEMTLRQSGLYGVRQVLRRCARRRGANARQVQGSIAVDTTRRIPDGEEFVQVPRRLTQGCA